MSTTVRNLRVVPRPYDHETDDDAISVQLSPLQWSLVQAAMRHHESIAVREVGTEIVRQVRAVQNARLRADILDAQHDYLDGA